MMFVTKYKPKTFDEIIGVNRKIIDVVSKGDIPHLLFYGSPGTGKTSTAEVISDILKCDILKLNASDERKIEVIRNKVKVFASTVSSNNKFKIVFLDEADALTVDSQKALRNMMEKYVSNCRFILTCNYLNKIEDALISRCQDFKVESPKKEDILNRLKYIIEQENIKITDEAVNGIIEIHYPDIRSCINKLDSLNTGKLITISDVNKDQLLVNDLFENLKTKPLSFIRQWLLDNNVDYKQLLVEMSNHIWKNLKSIKGASQLLLEIADSNYKITLVVDQDIEFTRLLLRCKQIMK